jgi:hypothetical protein
MKTAILLALTSLFLATPALARSYYYNPSFPNQPGSYNHHVQSSYHTALHSVAVTSVRDPNGNTWSGSPNGGAPGVKVVEGKATTKSYLGLKPVDPARLNALVAERLKVDPAKVFIQTSERTVRRPGSIFKNALDISYRVMDGNAVASSGKLLLVELKSSLGGRLFKAR